MGGVSKRTKFLGLASVAVLSVSGYVAVKSIVPAAQPTQPTSQSTTSNPNTAPAATTNQHTTTPVKAGVAKQKYKDGTYTGLGTTQIGSVQVAVTLKQDKITNVQITGANTHYPVSYIDPVLPQELMARQNINKIDVVSGATFSTYDFYYAVQSALSQAAQAESQQHA